MRFRIKIRQYLKESYVILPSRYDYIISVYDSTSNLCIEGMFARRSITTKLQEFRLMRKLLIKDLKKHIVE